METKQIHAALAAHRVKAQAFETLTAKVQAHFGTSNPPPVEVEAYIAACPAWEKLGMTQAEFYAMPTAWRLEQGEAYQPAAVHHSRRPVTRDLTPAELAQLQSEGLDRNTYTERARALQQTPAPSQEGQG